MRWHLSASCVRLGVALLLAAAGSLAAQDAVLLTDGRESYPLGLALELLEDPEGAWTIDDVTAPEIARRFVGATEPAPKLGITKSAWWVRFRVTNEADPRTRWLLVHDESFAQRIDLYLPAAGSPGYRVRRTGAGEPFTSRDVPHRRFVFDLPFLNDPPPGAPREGTVYLRVAGEWGLALPLELRSQTSLLRRDHRSLLLLGTFYGAVFIFVGYNLYLSVLLRQSSHLYYAANFIFLFVIFALQDGIFQLYLWPQDFPTRGWFVVAASFLATIFHTLFMRTFLQTRVYAPALHKASGALVLVLVLFSVLSPFVGFQILIPPGLLLIAAAIALWITAGVRTWIRGYRPARLFCLAWLVALAGDLFSPAVRLGFIPGVSVSLGESVIRLGNVGQAFVLSLALADKINMIRGEKEKVQRELVREQQLTLSMKEELNRELEARNADLARFYYALSHDIKNPIVTIRGFVGQVERDIPAAKTARIREDYARIRVAGDTLKRLVDQMVELSHLDRLVGIAEVRLSEMAEEAVASLAEVIDQRGVEVEIDRGLPVVRGERTRLYEVMRILVDNAVRHMGEVARPRLRIGARQDSSEIVCFVEDNGVGIDRRYHELVFGLFERLSADGEGTGIGLTRAQRIVEAHGGRIWVESEGAGQGSTFCFTLPPSAAPPPAALS